MASCRAGSRKSSGVRLSCWASLVLNRSTIRKPEYLRQNLPGTVMRTLNLPEIARLRSRLVPEYSVFGDRTNAEGEVLVSGIADAIAPDGQGGIDAVIDWKSDVNPSAEAIDHYRKQIDQYRRTIGAKRALLVFMTPGKIIEVT